MLASVVGVGAGEEDGSARADAGVRVDEGAGGDDVVDACAFVDADEGGLGAGGVGLDHGHRDDGDPEVREEA